ncbi:hypothetical protein BDZ91DRAFT_411594 [Kalaharituber pfeilii]|nr:hypothetical protein BDZ91DRAFT_411594 [Kalaharituber pfeilii]
MWSYTRIVALFHWLTGASVHDHMAQAETPTSFTSLHHIRSVSVKHQLYATMRERLQVREVLVVDARGCGRRMKDRGAEVDSNFEARTSEIRGRV